MRIRRPLTLLAACCGILYLLTPAAAQAPAAANSVTAAPPVTVPTAEISPTKRALILRFIEITDAKTMSVTVMDEYIKQMSALADQRRDKRIDADKSLTPAEKAQRKAAAAADSSRANEAAMTFFKEKFNFGEMIESISLELYDRHFTEAELQDLLTFYESPTGRKMIGVAPQLVRESFALTTARMETVMEEFYKFMDQQFEQQDEELRRLVAPQATPRPKRRH